MACGAWEYMCAFCMTPMRQDGHHLDTSATPEQRLSMTEGLLRALHAKIP